MKPDNYEQTRFQIAEELAQQGKYTPMDMFDAGFEYHRQQAMKSRDEAFYQAETDPAK